MSGYNKVFNRVEKKYLLTPQQYAGLRSAVEPYVHADKYGDSLICSLYFDTPNFQLIRASMQSPVYKEKLRLRCYGVPEDNTNAFVEVKKKYKKVVYKRRVDMTYAQAYSYLCSGTRPPEPSQITDEIDYMLKFYGRLVPSMAISYERTALYENFNDDLRLTFDGNIMWRNENLDFREGVGGENILNNGEKLLEIKTTGAMPMWLVRALDENGIYPTSFSKYARSFSAMLSNTQKEIVFGGINCA